MVFYRMDNTEDTENSQVDPEYDNNQMSITRPSLGSDGDYDDELGVPESIKVVDMGDGPVAIEHSDEELEGKLSKLYNTRRPAQLRFTKNFT